MMKSNYSQCYPFSLPYLDIASNQDCMPFAYSTLFKIRQLCQQNVKYLSIADKRGTICHQCQLGMHIVLC